MKPSLCKVSSKSVYKILRLRVPCNDDADDNDYYDTNSNNNSNRESIPLLARAQFPLASTRFHQGGRVLSHSGVCSMVSCQQRPRNHFFSDHRCKDILAFSFCQSFSYYRATKYML